MKNLRLFTLALLFVSATSTAGSLKNGKWTTSNCGVLPNVPLLDDSSVDAYNNSVAAITNWQQATTIYMTCMVKEATTDSNSIADAANKEQSNYNQTVSMIKAALAEASARLNNR